MTTIFTEANPMRQTSVATPTHEVSPRLLQTLRRRRSSDTDRTATRSAGAWDEAITLDDGDLVDDDLTDIDFEELIPTRVQRSPTPRRYTLKTLLADEHPRWATPPRSGVQRVTVPPPPTPPASRATLAERLRALPSMRDALHASRLCMDALLEQIPSRAAFVHLRDVLRNDVFVACAFGADAEFALLSRVGADPVLAMAVVSRRPIVLDERFVAVLASCERFPDYAMPRQVLTAPVLREGRLVAALELADPVRAPFGEEESATVDQVAKSLGTFLATHASVIDFAEAIHLCRGLASCARVRQDVDRTPRGAPDR